MHDGHTNAPGGEPTRTAEEFDAEVRGLVTDCAPRLFALVQVYGDGEDGRIAAWGLAHPEGGYDVVCVEGRVWMRLEALDRAIRHYGRRPEISVRVEWLSQAA